jgi:hypothetical protein
LNNAKNVSSLAPVVCQAAFASRTWAGASVILFFTGVLTPLNEKYPTYSGHEGGGGGISLSIPQPCIWQVSLQVRSDDARIRAALAVDVPSLVHEWFCGRISVLSHGQGPSAESLLSARSDLFSPQMSEPKGASDAVSYAITAMQDRSASLHAKIAAEIPVIFNSASASSSTVNTNSAVSTASTIGGSTSSPIKGHSVTGTNPNSPLIDEEDEEDDKEDEDQVEKEKEQEKEVKNVVSDDREKTTKNDEVVVVSTPPPSSQDTLNEENSTAEVEGEGEEEVEKEVEIEGKDNITDN